MIQAEFDAEVEAILRRHGAGKLYDALNSGLYGPTLSYVAEVNRGEREMGEPVEIDVGNSGTTMRLLAGWLAGQGGWQRLAEEVGRENILAICGDLERLLRPSRKPEALTARRYFNETKEER